MSDHFLPSRTDWAPLVLGGLTLLALAGVIFLITPASPVAPADIQHPVLIQPLEPR